MAEKEFKLKFLNILNTNAATECSSYFLRFLLFSFNFLWVSKQIEETKKWGCLVLPKTGREWSDVPTWAKTLWEQDRERLNRTISCRGAPEYLTHITMKPTNTLATDPHISYWGKQYNNSTWSSESTWLVSSGSFNNLRFFFN